MFVVGCGRSGTSLLRSMLDSHPGLAIPGESDLVLRYMRRPPEPSEEADWFLEVLARSRHVARWDGVNKADLLRTCCGPEPISTFWEGLGRVYTRYAQAHGKAIAGDKTPVNVLYLDALATALPNARFLHIIRDPRAVVASRLRVSLGASTVRAAAMYWADSVRAGESAGRRIGERYRALRYEKLVRDPEQSLIEIAEFLGLRYSPRMLDFQESGALFARADNLVAHSALSGDIDPSRTDGWRDALSPLSRAIVEAIAGDLLESLGYERTTPRALGRLALAGLSVTEPVDSVCTEAADLLLRVSRRVRPER